VKRAVGFIARDGTLGRVSTDLDQREQITARLRRIGQRVTGNREAIIDVLRAADRPLTLPEILSSRDGLAQSSVYRNLVVLEQAGIVHRIVTNDEYARFELAEDLTGDHHHHLVCVVCGSVEDVTTSPRLEESLHAAVSEIDRATGFTTEHHRIDLVGRCRDCA
jgi:Fe2+ or Zn2+ uptake regulation protein